MIAVLLLFLGALPPPTAAEVDRYGSAAAAYDSGDLEGAEAGFRSLSRSPTAIAPLARFAHGNSLVRRATRGTLPAREKNEALRAAIADYRAALDQSDAATPLAIRPEDARHNLELAKRLLVVESGSSASAPGDSRAAESRADSTTDRASSGPADPEATPPGEIPVRADSGPTRKTAGGLAFGDVGRLEPAEAQARLRSAISRIKRDRPRIRPSIGTR